MCLAAIAIDQSRRFPLVVAANRDEFLDRPAARLGWWSPSPGAGEILAGRDLHGGGTWLGLTAAGRMALLTNVRRPGARDDDAPSRGTIVPTWLRGDLDADRFWVRTALSGYNPFNLVAADFRRGECFWATSDAPAPRRLDRGLYGLSNAALDTPWPKVTALKEQVREALAGSDSAEDLSTRLFAALADRTVAPAFIRSADQRYGTRCSTLVITERVGKRLVTHVFERTFPVGGGLALLRHASLRDWPPKYSDRETVSSQSAPVADLADGAAPRRTRVRSLLRR